MFYKTYLRQSWAGILLLILAIILFVYLTMSDDFSLTNNETKPTHRGLRSEGLTPSLMFPIIYEADVKDHEQQLLKRFPELASMLNQPRGEIGE